MIRTISSTDVLKKYISRPTRRAGHQTSRLVIILPRTVRAGGATGIARVPGPTLVR